MSKILDCILLVKSFDDNGNEVGKAEYSSIKELAETMDEKYDKIRLALYRKKSPLFYIDYEKKYVIFAIDKNG